MVKVKGGDWESIKNIENKIKAADIHVFSHFQRFEKEKLIWSLKKAYRIPVTCLSWLGLRAAVNRERKTSSTFAMIFPLIQNLGFLLIKHNSNLFI